MLRNLLLSTPNTCWYLKKPLPVSLCTEQKCLCLPPLLALRPMIPANAIWKRIKRHKYWEKKEEEEQSLPVGNVIIYVKSYGLYRNSRNVSECNKISESKIDT